MNRRPDNEHRASGVFVRTEEVPFYLGGGWRVAEDIDGPVYTPRWALVQPLDQQQENAA